MIILLKDTYKKISLFNNGVNIFYLFDLITHYNVIIFSFLAQLRIKNSDSGNDQLFENSIFFIFYAITSVKFLHNGRSQHKIKIDHLIYCKLEVT